MSNLSDELENLKSKYREIFLKTSEEFQKRLEKIEPEKLLKFLKEDITKEIYQKLLKMQQYKALFSCSGCGACCKLACSEFSREELLEKAQNGDNYASQFVGVFVQYKSEDEAKSIYPEYFEFLKEKTQGEKVYFYHCPKVTADNKCCDYENRPPICKNFPDNPIGFLPKNCGFTRWKEEVEPTALMLHSLLEIVEFYKKKMND